MSVGLSLLGSTFTLFRCLNHSHLNLHILRHLNPNLTENSKSSLPPCNCFPETPHAQSLWGSSDQAFPISYIFVVMKPVGICRTTSAVLKNAFPFSSNTRIDLRLFHREQIV